MIDALTSHTLKHLREQWWDDQFTEFLAETLKPRPGNRILDVGCGEGLAEVSIGRLHISQVRLTGIDLFPAKVAEARRVTRSHNQRVDFIAGDACRLPLASGSFDSIFCVAVLQHVADVPVAVAEIARVARTNGRIVAVEPDNSARYLYSSVPSGARTFAASSAFFAAVAAESGEIDGTIGPKLPSLFAAHGVDVTGVRLFPVSHSQLGAPPADVWSSRRTAITRALGGVTSDAARRAGEAYLDALAAYERDATTAGAAFVEIQNTMLFATVGQRLGT